MTTQHGTETGGMTPEQKQRAYQGHGLHHDDEDGRLAHMRDSAVHAGDRALELGAGLMRVIRDNPVPAALIGAGAAWLAVSAMNERRHQEDHDMHRRHAASHGYGSGDSGHAHTGEEHEADRAAWAKRASEVKERASHLAHDARERTREWSHKARENASTWGHRATDTFENQPLLIGAMGLVIGAAIGASMPATRQENELLGGTRDRLRDDLASYGREQMDRAGSAAHEAMEEVRHKVKETGEQGMTEARPKAGAASSGSAHATGASAGSNPAGATPTGPGTSGTPPAGSPGIGSPGGRAV